MACHHIRETSVPRQGEIRRPPPPTVHWTALERCLPKTAVDAPGVRPWDARVSASAAAMLDPTVAVSLTPSPHLREVLRRPLESAGHSLWIQPSEFRQGGLGGHRWGLGVWTCHQLGRVDKLTLGDGEVERWRKEEVLSKSVWKFLCWSARIRGGISRKCCWWDCGEWFLHSRSRDRFVARCHRLMFGEVAHA